MSDLKTLRGLSGLSPEPASLKKAALILIDIQNTYRDGVLRLTGVEPAVAQAKILLRRAREAETPVIHIRHNAGPGSPFDITAASGQICEEVVPQDGEAVLTKAFPSAFVGTDLEDRLKRAGVTDLILAGFMTHMCVSATAKAALDLGYRTTVVAGASATRDLPDPLGGAMPAEQVHRAALTALADRFAIVVPGTAAFKG